LKKGQTSVEFVILMTFMIFVFTATFVVIQQKSNDVNENMSVRQTSELLNVIKNEVDMASASIDGYSKEFLIPDYINGEEFILELIDDELIIHYKDQTQIAFLNANITGNFSQYKGYHVISKISNQIIVGPGNLH